MDFTIYTFGDVEVFRAALAGVAMMFNRDGFFLADGGLGFGALAGLGLLIGLAVFLISSLVHQRSDVGGFVIATLVFALLFVPKFSVNIEDYNGEAIAKVDDVPLGIALPAGLVSGLAREMNIRMGTAFSTVEGYPSGVMTPQALTSPLKLLLSLREVAPAVRTADPVLARNLATFVGYCIAGRGTNDDEWAKTPLSADPVGTMLQRTGGGLTMWDDGSDPQLIPCAAASERLSAQTENFLQSPKMSGILTATAAHTNAAQITIRSGTRMVNSVTSDDQEAALQSIFQAGQDTAYAFLKTALLSPFINLGLYCASASSDPVAWEAKCAPLNQAFLQWSEDSAASGTFFHVIMFHGMNALFFIWICLAPVVALVMLFMGVRGLRLAGSYLLFGAWVVSWYIGASVVNFYLLEQLQNEAAMLGGLASLTPNSLPDFFGVLQAKIGLAGDMLSSVPLIMMTVLSGSMYGMVQLAGRWGSKDYYDQTANTPAAVGSAPLHQRAPMSSAIYSRPGIERAGYRDAGQIDLSSGLSHQVNDAQTSLHQQSRNLQATFQRDLSRTFQTGTSAEQGKALVDRLASSGMQKMASVESLANKVMTNEQLSKDRRHEIANALRASVGVEASRGVNPAGMLAKALGVSAGVELSTAIKAATGTTLTESESRAAESLTRSSKEFQAQLSSEMSSDNISRFVRASSDSSSRSDKTSWTNTTSALESYTQAHTTADALSQQQSYSQRIDIKDLARGLGSTDSIPAWTTAIDGAAAEYAYDPDFAVAYQRRLAAIGTTNIRGFDSQALTRIAQLQALQEVRPSAFSTVAHSLVGSDSRLYGPTDEHSSIDISAANNAGSVTGYTGRDPTAAVTGSLKTTEQRAGDKGAVQADLALQREKFRAFARPSRVPDATRLDQAVKDERK